MKLLNVILISLFIAGCGKEYNKPMGCQKLNQAPTWLVQKIGQAEADLSVCEQCNACGYATDQYGTDYAHCTGKQ